MQLIGDHQAEDRQLISEVVLVQMNRALAERSASVSRSPTCSPQGQKPTTVQPQQVQTLQNSLCLLNTNLTFYCNSGSQPTVLISKCSSFSFACVLFPALTQSAAPKEGLADPNRTSSQRPQPQGCLDSVVHSHTSAARQNRLYSFLQKRSLCNDASHTAKLLELLIHNSSGSL